MRTVELCVICQHRTPEQPMVCDGCRRRMIDDLTNLVAAWQSLSAEPGKGATVRVSGTREKPLGVKVAALDLMLPARHIRPIRDIYGDQTGAQPVAVLLDSWVRDWAELRGEHLPAPTVSNLAAWLDIRLDWACDEHPAIDDYAREVRGALSACLAAIDALPAKPELCDGVACQWCDMRALWRAQGRIGCANCGRIYEAPEYHAWVKELARPLAS